MFFQTSFSIIPPNLFNFSRKKQVFMSSLQIKQVVLPFEKTSDEMAVTSEVLPVRFHVIGPPTSVRSRSRSVKLASQEKVGDRKIPRFLVGWARARNGKYMEIHVEKNRGEELLIRMEVFQTS